MRYGNFNQPLRDVTEDLEALKDLLSKGEITQAQYKKKREDLRMARLMAIVASNGGYTISSKKLRKAARSIKQQRTDIVEEKTKSLRERLIDQEQEV